MAKLKFIFQNDVKRLFDCFGDLFGARISFSSFEKSTSTEFTEVLVNGYHAQTEGCQYPSCEYCSLLRQDLNLEHRCFELDEKKIAETKLKKHLVSYICYGGMVDAIIPIIISNEIIGIVMIGQIRTGSKEMPPAIRRLWKKKFNNQKLKRAYNKVPHYTAKKLDEILDLFSIMIKNIITNRMILKEESVAIEPLISYMKENLNENLSLDQAASFICCGKSTLCHTFKAATGKSFKNYQIQLKIKKAKEYFNTIPNITVREVASKLGYDDPFYFCRLYKKYTGNPPSTEIKRKNAEIKP